MGGVMGILMGRQGDSSHVVMWGQPMELPSWQSQHDCALEVQFTTFSSSNTWLCCPLSPKDTAFSDCVCPCPLQRCASKLEKGLVGVKISKGPPSAAEAVWYGRTGAG